VVSVAMALSFVARFNFAGVDPIMLSSQRYTYRLCFAMAVAWTLAPAPSTAAISRHRHRCQRMQSG
jgi:hypothetical protein